MDEGFTTYHDHARVEVMKVVTCVHWFDLDTLQDVRVLFNGVIRTDVHVTETLVHRLHLLVIEDILVFAQTQPGGGRIHE